MLPYTQNALDQRSLFKLVPGAIRPASNYQNELYLMSGIIFEKTLAFHPRHNWALAGVSTKENVVKDKGKEENILSVNPEREKERKGQMNFKRD